MRLVDRWSRGVWLFLRLRFLSQRKMLKIDSMDISRDLQLANKTKNPTARHTLAGCLRLADSHAEQADLISRYSAN